MTAKKKTGRQTATAKDERPEPNISPASSNDFYEAVYKLVRDIPRGRVMTYGQIATIVGMPRAARAVGFAMRVSANKRLPWHRVINHRGGISARGEVERPAVQRILLEKEGVKFNASECCDLRKYRWEPAEPELYLFIGAPDLPF